MDARREYIQRGTPDFPLSCYHFHHITPGRIVATTHWHPEQEILYVKGGAIEVLIGKQTHIIGQNQLCFIAPNALHSVKICTPDTDYYALVYSYQLLTLPETHFFQIAVTSPMQSGELAFPMALDSNDPASTAAIEAIDRVCACNSSSPAYKSLVFHSLITLYTTMMDKLAPAKALTSTTENRVIKTCLDYIHLHYPEKITLEQLAQLVHLHPNYLCKLFKAYTGQTAFQQLMHIRLENAAKLLVEGGCSVAQVAEACGFESISFFSRKFKQHMGASPKTYCRHAAKPRRPAG